MGRFISHPIGPYFFHLGLYLLRHLSAAGALVYDVYLPLWTPSFSINHFVQAWGFWG